MDLYLSVVFKVRSNAEIFFRYENNPNDPKVFQATGYLVYFDHSGILWVGYWGTGASKWDKNKWKFPAYGGTN